MSERDIERAICLLEQLEAQYDFENGLIDPVDWERFTAGDLLRVADGVTTLEAIVWGDALTPEEQEKHELEKLEAWQKAVTMTWNNPQDNPPRVISKVHPAGGGGRRE